MRWTPGGQSDNIEDQRSTTAGGGGGMRLGLGGIVVLFILSVVFKKDFFSLLNTTQGGMATTTTSQPNPAQDAKEQPLVQFVSFVLDDAQKEWREMRPLRRRRLARRIATPSWFCSAMR